MKYDELKELNYILAQLVMALDHIDGNDAGSRHARRNLGEAIEMQTAFIERKLGELKP